MGQTCSPEGIEYIQLPVHQKLMGEFVRSNFQPRYKTTQQYDLSKRLWNSLSSAGCLQQWSDVLGEWSDFQCAELNTLSALQNMHSLSKIVLNSLQDSYPAALLSTLFVEGCKLLATCLRSARLTVHQCICASACVAVCVCGVSSSRAGMRA